MLCLEVVWYVWRWCGMCGDGVVCVEMVWCVGDVRRWCGVYGDVWRWIWHANWSFGIGLAIMDTSIISP